MSTNLEGGGRKALLAGPLKKIFFAASLSNHTSITIIKTNFVPMVIPYGSFDIPFKFAAIIWWAQIWISFSNAETYAIIFRITQFCGSKILLKLENGSCFFYEGSDPEPKSL